MGVLGQDGSSSSSCGDEAFCAGPNMSLAGFDLFLLLAALWLCDMIGWLRSASAYVSCWVLTYIVFVWLGSASASVPGFCLLSIFVAC